MAGTWEASGIPGIRRQQDKRRSTPARTVWRYQVLYRDLDGKPKTWTTPAGIEKPRQVAIDKHRELHEAKRKGNLPRVVDTKRTLADVYAHMLSTGHQRPTTLAWYANSWRLIEPAFGRRSIRGIQRAEIEKFYSGIEKVPTRRAVAQLLHKLMEIALRQGWIERNEAHGVELPAIERDEVQALTVDEVHAIANNVPDRYRCLVYVMAFGGLRVGEAVALQVRDINGTIQVRRNATEVDGRMVTGEPKTASSRRVVGADPELQRLLHEHVAEYVKGADTSALVFSTPRGMMVRPNNFRKREFADAVRAAGIDRKVRIHDLRHTCASLLIARDVPLFDVSRFLGHSSTRVTESTYAHWLTEKPQQVAARLGDVWA